MVLKTVHDKLDEIPEAFRELYTEKAGKWELTGITGVKTEADVARLTTSLEKERKDHKETKAKLALWGDRDVEETLAALDRIPELEKASKGKVDDAALDEMANKRAEKLIASKLAPVQRSLEQMTKERDTLKVANEGLTAGEIRRQIHDDVRAAATKLKLVPEAIDDALMYGERLMQRTEDGKIVTKEGVGFTPGLNAEGLLGELLPKRPHWQPPSVGGGAGDRRGGGGGGSGKDNPWTQEGWNLTKQGEMVRTLGVEKAAAMAAAAGSRIGATGPTVKAK